MYNFYGDDVDALINLLIQYYYLPEGYGRKFGGYYLYDEGVKYAVMHFQKDAGLEANGCFGIAEKASMDGWNYGKTTIELGIRELMIHNIGSDVTELTRLLCVANKVNLASSDEYTENVAEAVRQFQTTMGLPVTGIADLATINVLKSVAK